MDNCYAGSYESECATNMELSNPVVDNIDQLAPLVPYVILYLSLLIILRLLIWPIFLRIRRQSTLAATLNRLLRRFLFLAGILFLVTVMVASFLSITGTDVTLDIGIPSLDGVDLGAPALGDVVPSLDWYVVALILIVLALITLFFLQQPWIGRGRRE